MRTPQTRSLPLRPRPARRGMAMALTMLVLMGLMALMLLGSFNAGGGTGGALSNANGGVQSASAHMASADALDLAESGAEYARLWLTTQAAPPAGAGAFPPFTAGGAAEWGATLSGGTPGRAVVAYPDAAHTFSVTIYPDASNGGSTTKRYLVESVGASGAARVVLHVVLQETSFAKYAYFDDNDHPHPGGTNVWGYPITFQGPFHDNNSNGQSMAFVWGDNDPTTMFQADQRDSFSFSGAPNWWGPGTAAADYAHLTAGGQQNMTFGWQTNPDGSIKKDAGNNPLPNSPRIPLPTTNYAPEYAALGRAVPNPATSAPSGTPTVAGVTLSANGGIFLHADTNPSTGLPDDVQTVTLSALPDAQGKNTIQQILITQPVASGSSTVTHMQRVTINPGTNTTTLETSTNGGHTWTLTQTQAGTTNGAIYADCNIGQNNGLGTITGGVSGTVADNVVSGSGAITHNNSLSLTADIASGKDIYIAGSLTYSTARNQSLSESQDTAFLQKAGTMGLVASQVVIPNDTGVKTGGTVNLEIDASIFAKDTFEDQDPNHRELGVGSANLVVVGGLIEGNVAFIQLSGGYTEHYDYDTRMADYPPPYFPAVSNTYTTLSWQQVPSTLE